MNLDAMFAAAVCMVATWFAVGLIPDDPQPLRPVVFEAVPADAGGPVGCDQ